jgi:LAO/AO transport system kinase
MHWSDYWERFLAKDSWATGKLINIIENESDSLAKKEILQACARQRKEAYVVGITGPPGAGKSTIVDQLGCWFLDMGYTVAVICIDPSSPFRGGALLGDRIRFNNLSKRQGYFVRSMATRGNLGGLALATSDAVRLLEAGGYDVIMVETVGTGQTEYDIISTADTIILVTVPGLGDQIQAAKAGIMEIGDIFVVNQSDRPGAEETIKSLKLDIKTFYCNDDWVPHVLATVATLGEGISQLGKSTLEHRDHLLIKGKLANLQKNRRKQSWIRLMEQQFHSSLEKYLKTSCLGEAVEFQVESGQLDIYEASNRVLSEIILNFGKEVEEVG